MSRQVTLANQPIRNNPCRKHGKLPENVFHDGAVRSLHALNEEKCHGWCAGAYLVSRSGRDFCDLGG
jgi:sulfopyruvate decarboxylase TPP-binding subunit